MSHKNVETVIGRLVTDEAFRAKFALDPRATIAELTVELTKTERDALSSIDPTQLERATSALDPRLVKADLGRKS
jgi:hypothetical protein